MANLRRRRAQVAVIQAYTAFRRRVQQGRHAGESSERMAAGLVKVLRGRGFAVRRLVLGQIAGGLQHARRRRCAWGNVKKSEDNMFRLLRLRAPSAAGWTPADAHQLLVESIRARVLCLTSTRFASGRCPPGPLACCDRPYQIFGRGIGFTEDGAQARFCRWRSEWRALAAGRVAIGAVSRRQPLTDARLRMIISAGSFARLQVLTDFMELLGRSYVKLPDDFGPGVVLDGHVLRTAELEELRRMLSSSGSFRKAFDGSPRVDQVAHLICEVRQALLRGRRQSAREAFFAEVEQLARSGSSVVHPEDRLSAQAIAHFAAR